MSIRRHIASVVLAFSVALAGASSVAGQSGTDWECDGLQDYHYLLWETMPDDRTSQRAIETVMSTDDISTLRPSTMIAASDAFDAWSLAIEDIPDADVPRAAEEHRDAMVDTFSLMSSVLLAWGTSGPFGAMAYVDALDQAGLDADRAMSLGEQRCGDEWTDVFGATSVAEPSSL